MPVENATKVSELVETNPLGSDPIGKGDDHIRLIKNVLKNDVLTNRLNPDTLSDWQNDNTAQADDVATTAERSTGNGGGATGAIISGTDTANTFDKIAHNTLALTFGLRKTFNISVEAFGVKNGDSFDNGAIFTFLSTLVGFNLTFEKGGIYRSSKSLITPVGGGVDILGSTIHFVISGAEKCLVISSNSYGRNGSIDATVTAPTGSGDSGTPVVFGTFLGLEKTRNASAKNLTLSTDKPGANALTVVGDVANVDIDNIIVPDSSTITNVILIHWGRDTSPPSITVHPKNIRVDGVEIGTLTNAGSGAVFLSAVQNISIKNLTMVDSEGYGISNFAGDWGFKLALVPFKSQAGVTFENIILGTKGRAIENISIDAGIDTPSEIFPTIMKISQSYFTGTNNTDSGNQGCRLENTHALRLDNVTLDGFHEGIGGAAQSSDVIFDDVKIINSFQEGYRDNTTGFLALGDINDIHFNGGKFKDNNTSTTGGTLPDVRLFRTKNIEFNGVEFDSPLTSTNIRSDSGTDRATDVRVLRCKFKTDTTTSTILSFGDGADTDICSMYSENTFDFVPGFAFGGQLVIPIANIATRGAGARMFSADVVPSIGTFVVGDTVIKNVPEVAQPQGWKNLTDGTGGTLAGVTGGITIGTPDLVVNTAIDLTKGNYITIVGVSGIKRIIAISGLNITLESNADQTVSGAAVAYSPFSMQPMPNL